MTLPDLRSGKSYAVFDAYGTLFDVHSAVARHAGALGPQADSLSEVWRTKQLEYSWVHGLMGRYVAFWDLTERALDFALAKHPEIDRDFREKLLDAYRDLDAYDEVPGVLERLRERGVKTALFSNGNAAMLERAVASSGLGERLDAVLSVDPIRTFKTAPAAYQMVLDQLATERNTVLFFSSNRWDIAGATAFGFDAVWVNRKGQPDEYPDQPPRAVVKSLDAVI
ncbi:UNVERIFIED_ORG: 2-haloacid dehalogenase [Methylobacterium sp. SuP10 SLI 274]|uniref:haloacid dehalogenase type II n=1 Tax=Methylorubrum extorquens TaxID=408 RepID=UPI00209F0943|nr:haloacid dehalogenase type II [Methylorubrum extorquens]MDF9864456.1 2-haloacid dehalogenase [Methylorubrum pseudosasae]MDH6638043.1 2-haloacid dehalogenase [Methylobacterium sp. SuP10 SLI 274]MDH6667224.1 2-haloacid dehalogenase [Methylorubrum zatmanii]MCP1559128.1 2-haloacid dehalogenase [Methylorubrum extorquens]MDF9792768.1 2-haloacid dehalogenase [Methylorubrum extorquens]